MPLHDRHRLTITLERPGHVPQVLVRYRICGSDDTNDLRPALIRTARKLIAGCQRGINRDRVIANYGMHPEDEELEVTSKMDAADV